MPNGSLSSVVVAVERALAILEVFTPDRAELGLTELAKSVGLPKATTYRLASTLEKRHYLSRDPDSNRYRLGLRSAVLGNLALSHSGLGDHVLSTMRELAQVCGETVNLAVLEDGDVCYVKRVRSMHPLVIDVPVGGRAPAHATALGKVLLAYLPETEVDRIISSKGLAALTTKTVTDVEALKAQLQLCRQQGYIIEKGEFADGVHCVSAPIFDQYGRAIASISVAGPDVRMTEEKLAQVRQQLFAMVGKISTTLGYRTGTRVTFEVDGTARAGQPL